jgi:hypothetical protein
MKALLCSILLAFSARLDAQWVDSVAPPPHAQNVDRSTSITAVFTVDVQPSSLIDTTILVYGSLSGRHVSSGIEYGNPARTAVFHPQNNFVAGESVEVVLTTGIMDLGGQSMPQAFGWGFRIALDTGLFVLSSTIASGDGPWSAAAGDWDGDGYSDLAVPDRWAGTVEIMKNDGKGNFIRTQTVTVGDRPLHIAVGDIDRDGDLDLAVVDWVSNEVSILKNDGAGTFAVSSTVRVGSLPEGIDMGDFDGDGDSDIVVGNSGGTTVSILTNDGHGAFTQTAAYAVEAAPVSVIARDVDKDHHPDLIVTNFFSNSVSILKNDGRGNFALRATIAMNGTPESPVSGDWNKDGNIDLAVVNNSSATLSILTGSDSGFFSYAATVDILLNSGTTVEAVAGDWNRDGYTDLVVTCGDSHEISILLNDGTGKFSEASREDLGQTTVGVVAGDWDHDGDLDLAVTHDPTNSISILKNKSILAGIRKGAREIPYGYSLWQNYPNPFNPSTTIMYELPGESFVSLRVYNLLGEEVSRLTEGYQAAGRHQIQFAADRLSSGIYFYRLHTGQFTQQRKMTLLK